MVVPGKDFKNKEAAAFKSTRQLRARYTCQSPHTTVRSLNLAQIRFLGGGLSPLFPKPQTESGLDWIQMGVGGCLNSLQIQTGCLLLSLGTKWIQLPPHPLFESRSGSCRALKNDRKAQVDNEKLVLVLKQCRKGEKTRVEKKNKS